LSCKPLNINAYLPKYPQYGDKTLERPWSKYSQGSSAHTKRSSNPSTNEDTQARKKPKTDKDKMTLDQTNTLNTSAEFQQFIAAAKPQASAKIWANDAEGKVSTKDKGQKKKQEDKQTQEVSGMGKVIQSSVASRKRGGEGVVHKRTHIIFDDSDEDTNGNTGNEPNQNSDSDDEYQDFFTKPELNQEDNDEEEEEEEEEDEEESEAEGEKSESKAEKEESEKERITNNGTEVGGGKRWSSVDVQSAAETGRLFIRNLPFSLREDELKKLFSKYGEISEVHLPIDKNTKMAKGVGFVRFSFPENAVKALSELDGTIYQGRLLHVLPAQLNPKEASTNPVSLTFKQQREQEKRRQGVNEKEAWNSLFLRSDTVATAMAEQYGVSKGELLGDERQERTDSMAVRLALGETKVIAETKKMFEQEGVDLKVLADSQFNPTKIRSNTTIITKNLPHTTNKDELRGLFGRYGELGRIILAPSRAIAIIEFLEPNEAKAAFKSLAYTKFKHLPLYLEWSPEKIFLRPHSSATTDEADEEEDSKTEVSSDQQKKPEIDDDIGGETTTLFVKNLSFETTEETLSNLFRQFSPRSIVIAKRKYPQIDAKLSTPSLGSLGYGFVEFRDKQQAVEAMKSLQVTSNVNFLTFQ